MTRHLHEAIQLNLQPCLFIVAHSIDFDTFDRLNFFDFDIFDLWQRSPEDSPTFNSRGLASVLPLSSAVESFAEG